MLTNKQGWFSIMVNRLVSLIFVLFFCGFISFIAVNGTNKIYGKSEVQNISYKLPESWIANISDKQFRLLELSENCQASSEAIKRSTLQAPPSPRLTEALWVVKRCSHHSSNLRRPSSSSCRTPSSAWRIGCCRPASSPRSSCR